MENATYFLIPKFREQNLEEDYKKLLSWFEKQETKIVEERENGFRITYVNIPQNIYIELQHANQSQGLDIGKIMLQVSFGDSYSIRNIKEFANVVGYKIYSLQLKSFIPRSPYIQDLTNLPIKPELIKIFSDNEFEPLFVEEVPQQGTSFFARKKGKEEIHIINPGLLNYYLNWNTNIKSGEFSYQVAENIQRFTLYADRGLIPFTFYNMYGKGMKIFNLSGIDLNNPQRKIFIKPIVRQIDSEENNFFNTKQDERGSMILMDKIREGENLDMTLNRILKEWKLADSYLRALVAGEVEFDKDKAGILIPRVIVFVYVEKILKTPEATQRGWDPIKQ